MTRASKWLLCPALLLGLAGSAHAQVKLETRHTEDSKSTVETTTKITQTLTIQGMEIDTRSEQTATVSTVTGKRRDDGSLPLNVTIEAMKADITLPNTTISFDSSAPAPKQDDPQTAVITDVLRAMVGTSYTIVLDKNGQATSVEGVDKTIEKARELNPQAAEALQSQLNAENVKREFAEEAGRLPSKTVNKGETWSKTDTMNLGAGQTMTFDRTYEYLGPETRNGKALEKIGIKTTKVTYAMKGSNSPVTVDKSDLKVESSEGALYFDPEAGEVVERTNRTQVKGSLTLSASGQTIPADLDLTIEQNETTSSK